MLKIPLIKNLEALANWMEKNPFAPLSNPTLEVQLIRAAVEALKDKPLVLPQVNINGTSREALVAQQSNVLRHLDVLQHVMNEAAPNGRDFQRDPVKLKEAGEAWRERMRMLDTLYKEIEAHALAIQDQ